MDPLLRKHRNAILAFAAKHGARNVRLFGSRARGSADPGSDVDLLVEIAEGRTLFDIGGFLMDVQDLLGCKVDVVTERSLNHQIRDRILSEAIAL